MDYQAEEAGLNDQSDEILTQKDEELLKNICTIMKTKNTPEENELLQYFHGRVFYYSVKNKKEQSFNAIFLDSDCYKGDSYRWREDGYFMYRGFKKI